MSQGVYFSSHKKRKTAFWLCVFLGIFGGHYFYVGRIFRGILALCTLNFLMIGWVFDLIKIARGRFKDWNGLPLID
jgi:restriction system protein